jgi:nitronate monooxygenase
MAGSSFLSQVGIRLPIIQAPMAGVSTPVLAADVSNAGGLGAINVAAMTPEQASAAITETHRLTSGPFNVNVFCHAAARRNPKQETEWLRCLAPLFREFGEEPPSHLQLLYKSFVEDDEMLSVLLDLKPAVVSFHFGLASPKQIRALKEAGILLLATATNLQEAKQITAAGLDGVVAQGIEAGGHRGTFDLNDRDEGLGTVALTRLIAYKLSIPVISAGGIMDGAGIVAALSLGAHAAQLGTAFVACPESAADSAYREALLSGTSQTVMTCAISGRPARGLVNRFTAFGGASSCTEMPDYPLPYFAGKALNALAKQHGNSSFAAQWAGQGVSMVRAMRATELVKMLSMEMEEATKNIGKESRS